MSGVLNATSVNNRTHKPAPVAERYGMLKVILFVPKKGWLCKCDCGIEKYIEGNPLRTYKHMSCGCNAKARQADSLRARLEQKKKVKKVAAKKPRRYRTGTPCWVCRNKIGEVVEAPVVLCKVCERGGI